MENTIEIFRRKDIDWSLKRPDGKTNFEAAKEEGLAPLKRNSNGFYEPVELHFHHQNKDGPLVELWRSKQKQVPDKMPPPSWRKQFPDEQKIHRIFESKYWQNREIN